MAYEYLAKVYDQLMTDYDYGLCMDWLDGQVDFYGDILEMACGTGTLTEKLSQRGPVTAFDGSLEMLDYAQMKIAYNPRIQFLHQDLRDFSLVEKYDTVVCFCDSLNYLLDKEDLQACFRRVHDHLKPGAWFYFDVNTPYKYGKMADNIFAQESAEALALWQNSYDGKSRINDYNLTIFQSLDPEGETYRRYDEVHQQRAYDRKEIQGALVESGFEEISYYDGYGKKEAGEKTERLVVKAKRRENGK